MRCPAFFSLQTVRAQAIIDHRPYHDFDDLLKINGFGTATVNMLRIHARLTE